ncbi:LysR family transcriptional regulator [Pyxidicoccus fallax]|uniref:LysR family transcriptional regulator n=1 Tax=Pyxidicoccus fallax TaxID=394095 RepID=A0A848L989_9BACT|nr:LysR family transcriptional regulator [Pyxidicoccus fallax]NMO13405.1 LysR family transcriptional regulator [Pyxidicoccus fallax]NPC80314.1 LysR family transcriptional regulator [Pyxidicoccus fallax]
MNDELEGMAVFVAVAESKSLREAGERLGVSGSAVSQALSKLEARLGVTLVQRTTRSLRLTDAGERLYASVGPALAEVRAAASAVGALGGEPRGTLRLLVSPAAASFLGGELMRGFVAEHRHVHLDLFFSDEPIDVVAGGYDAGIRLGEVIDKDMIAVPVSGELRLLVVGAPSYFARRPKPTHPRELVEHECINWRPAAGAPPYRWEFTEKGRDFSVEVPARVLTNDVAFNLRLARAGVGITLSDDRVRDQVARGELVAVLEEFSTPFPGFFLYYPQRRHASPALRAFIDYLREARRQDGGPARSERRKPARRPER